MSVLCVPCVPWHTRFSEDPILKIGSVCANMGSFNSIGKHGLNIIKTSLDYRLEITGYQMKICKGFVYLIEMYFFELLYVKKICQ